ncbi:ABC transporter ATP-binding protein [Roseixanthobacter glucoisosaccharinicivorans]|uniref:ABC transporter ATP-binding protein n=1 Tax=Roseixanthobacter glucoisosaccharinicivorans TaxID=3119923 RepID=UPI00372A83AD
MAGITISNVSKSFPKPDGKGTFVALSPTDIEVQEGEFVCILGPSGCGKTTLLNIIAGFEKPSTGEVLVGGKPVKKPGPERGYVFQEYALFPWMTVAENAAFGLRNLGMAVAEAKQKAGEFLKLVGLAGFEDSYPNRLSGGMKQRVAIARALAPNPDILLLDEPFAALDAQTRYLMQIELLRIQRESKKTMVLITHSLEEAIVLADRVIVLSARPGRIKLIEAIDHPHTRNPNDPSMTELRYRLFQAIADEIAPVGAAA